MSKTIKRCFDEKLTFQKLVEAYERAKRGKGLKREILLFEMDLETNLIALFKELKDGSYRFGKYHEFIIKEPKERLIRSLPFRDRIVHQWYVEEFIKPYVFPRMIKDTYACIDGRGTHKAVFAVQKYMRRMQKQYGNYIILQCDIKKFFYSIDKDILYSILKKKISDLKLLSFTRCILEDGMEKGIPIGNYTSQYFANLYLNELDHYVKEELKILYYVRYMDDFVILLEDKAGARRIKAEITTFLKEKLGLELNQKSRYFPSYLGGWAIYLVKRIERLKNKVDHFDDDRYDHQLKSGTDDEIRSLEEALEEMRILQRTQEESRNQMYQNTSHDLKTPIAVIKSYIEALEDNMEEEATVIQVIKEQTDKLEQKVRTLLYLNKLDYLKDESSIYNITFDITEILNSSIKKFKFQRKDLKFITRYDKDTIFRGSSELWEAIIDNLLNNFMRYVKTTVKITVKNGKIVFFNDGEAIDEKIIDKMFSPYKKGLNGEFGLGLSIVKKTLRLLGYEISVKNIKSGVQFTIK